MIEERTLTEPTLPGAGLTRGIVPGGTFLADFLYPAPAERRIGAIIGWWERRRLPYNLIIGGTGLVTGTVVSLMMALNGESEPLMWFRAGLTAAVGVTLAPIVFVTIAYIAMALGIGP